MRWSPPSLEVEAPADDLVFTCLDDEPLQLLWFRVIVDEGEPPAWVSCTYERRDNRLPSLGPMQAGYGRDFEHPCELKFLEAPPEARIEWCLSADGFVSVWGDRTSFREEGERYIADVHLRAGWGAKVLVLDATNDANVPLQGASVLVDGVEAGETDASGCLFLSRTERPASLEAKLEGWRAAAIGGRLAIDEHTDASWLLELRLERGH